MQTHSKVLSRVLCVDDDPDIRIVLEFALRRVGGLEVAICASGIEALARAQDFAPDLMLLDAVMPGLDGPATLRKLRAIPALAHVPTLFLTAKADSDEMENYAEMGADGILAKPFDAMKLADVVRGVWERTHG